MTYQVEIIYFYVLQTENAAFLGGNREKESCKIFKASEYFESLLLESSIMGWLHTAILFNP